ncbi:MAG: GAF domain-containing protein [Chitinophagaceae bacterium]|nr:GAF domain-containing protein [Chitinophagaceae bacterium]
MKKISFTDILQSSYPRKEKARLLAERIRQAGDYSWVGLYDVKEKEITLVAFAGRTEPAFTSFPKDKGLNGKAVMQKRTVIVNDAKTDEDYLLTFTNTESEIIVPVSGGNNGTIKGTIDAESETKNAFSKEDAAFLEECAAAIRSLWETDN